MIRPLIATVLLLAAAFGAGTAHAQAQTVQLAGVIYPPTVQLAGSTLQLNGAGLRYKFIIKVYTAGLYMVTKASTTDAVLATPGPKHMHVVMLRDIDANELGRLFTRGMQDNAPREEISKFIPGTLRMADIFSSRKKNSMPVTAFRSTGCPASAPRCW